ncbi:MAG: hypothetical protein K6F84_07960 [Lachnospiraceae bacterium]|nr:hypothetical protein [Lachnospiraceae bacterium]
MNPFKLFLMTSKRLLKTPAFIAVLFVMPLFALLVKGLIKKDDSILKVGFCFEESSFSDSDTCEKIKEEILDKNGIFNFQFFEDERDLMDSYEAGKMGVAWVIAGNPHEKFDEMAKADRLMPLVRVYYKEDTIPVRFAGEILSGICYKYFAYSSYVTFMDRDAGVSLSDDALKDNYEKIEIKDDLYSSVKSGEKVLQKDDGLFMQPFRGILGIWLLMCIFIGGLYYAEDVKKGCFSNVSLEKRKLIPFIYCGAAAVFTSVLYVTELGFMGLFGDLIKETTGLITVVVMDILWVTLVVNVIKSDIIYALGGILWLLNILCCNIFIAIPGFEKAGFLFPVYHYLKFMDKPSTFVYCVYYIVVLMALNLLLRHLPQLQLPILRRKQR